MDTLATPAVRPVKVVDPALYAESSLREKIIEHTFVAQLLRTLWRHGRRDIEVLRSDVDCGGYDLALHSNGILRHVQLKSSYREAATSTVKASLKLAAKPSGCILWILFDQTTLELGPFRWLGGEPGASMPDLGEKIARHTKANIMGEKSERPGFRVIPRGRFTALATMDEVIAALFGRDGRFDRLAG